MGKSTKPFLREMIECLKLVTDTGAVGTGSLIINDLFVFTKQEVSSIKKRTLPTFLDALTTERAILLFTAL